MNRNRYVGMKECGALKELLTGKMVYEVAEDGTKGTALTLNEVTAVVEKNYFIETFDDATNFYIVANGDNI